jgi:hypothetical protein
MRSQRGVLLEQNRGEVVSVEDIRAGVIMSEAATMDAQKWADPATTPNNDGS